MKKRMIALILCLMMILPAASAEQPTPMDLMFQRVKDSLALMAMGETEQALTMIGFVFDVESELTADTFRELVETGLVLLDSGMVQTEVALCWLDEMGVYHFGIPLVEPISPDVEALVLCSRDLVNFSSYYATTWNVLEQSAALYENTVWNMAYQAGAPVLFADE